MQIETAQATTRQQLQDDVLALIRSRTAAADVARPQESAARDKPPAAVPAGPGETDKAIGEISQAMKVLATSLHFEVDEDSGRTLVKVVDRDSGELLRQIPSEATLQIARSLDKLTGQLVDHTA